MNRLLFSSLVSSLIGLLALTVIASSSHSHLASATKRKPIQATGRADAYKRQPIQIAFRGTHDIKASYTGLVTGGQALEQQATQPLTMASGDFDEDGVMDLICGHADGGRGLITLYRGNAAAMWPRFVSGLRDHRPSFGPESRERSESSTLDPQP
ncbi:MAG: hypothetical protein NZ823_00125, partial [Blastocatellia bacterium]|nr:hypothetical protein [Blastocatellia bacterium]